LPTENEIIKPIKDFINKPVIVNLTGDERNQHSLHFITLKFIIYSTILRECSRSTWAIQPNVN